MALFFFITCKSTTRKTIFEVPTTYATNAYYSVFKPEFLVEYSLISVQSIWIVYVLKIYYKSYRMGDLSEFLLLLIPSLLNPKFCFRLFLVQSVCDINFFFPPLLTNRNCDYHEWRDHMLLWKGSRDHGGSL